MALHVTDILFKSFIFVKSTRTGISELGLEYCMIVETSDFGNFFPVKCKLNENLKMLLILFNILTTGKSLIELVLTSQENWIDLQ